MSEKVNINSATEKELDQLVHIGPIRAVAIINNRPYKDVYELSKVFQLGTKRMADIISQGLVVV